jgi:hypothetical protein
MTPEQFSSKHLGKNLELTWAVHERLPRTLNRRSPDAIAITVTNRFAMQGKGRLDSSGKIQQIPNSDIRFVRLVLPFPNGVFHRFIQIQDSVLFCRNRRNAPKALGAAENRSDSIRSIAV